MCNITETPKRKLRGKNAVYTSGDKYGYLMLTGKAYMGGTNGGLRYVEVICECGKIWFTVFKDVLSGRTKSCGCKRMSFILAAITTHGMASKGGHPIYKAWWAMQQRCKGLREEDFNNYTSRGIVVCDEWINSFDAFRKWSIENGWKKGLSLDRFPNNDGNYEPGNCRWATDPMQNRNKRNNLLITAFGETKCMAEWCEDERCSVYPNTIKHRINILKWDTEKAITHPSKNLKEHRKGDRRNSLILNYRNENKSLAEWCISLGLKYHLIWNRIFMKGWEVQRAFETKKGKFTNKRNQ